MVNFVQQEHARATVSDQTSSAQFLGYAMLGLQFLRVAENCCNELVERDNTLTVVVGGYESFDLAAYEEATGWSDHKIAVPILFNYFHGIELTLKAFLVHAGVSGVGTHKLTTLLQKFERLHAGTDLCVRLDDAIRGIKKGSPLRAFLDRNNLTIDSWYEALKYPETKQGSLVTHTELKYKGTDGVEFWTEVRDAAQTIRLTCLDLARTKGIAH